MLIAIIVVAVVALIIGIFISYLMKGNNNSKLISELNETKKQLGHYQNTINEHVYKTHEIMENINLQFQELQKQSHDYSVKLNLDHSRQSLLQPKSYRENNDATNNLKGIPKDYPSADNQSSDKSHCSPITKG